MSTRNMPVSLDPIRVANDVNPLIQFSNLGSEKNRMLELSKIPKIKSDRIQICSFGCGVDSWGALTLWGDIYDEIIFVDTGAEPIFVYQFLEYAQQYFHITVIQSPLKDLFNYYHKRKIIPTVSSRQCTDKFKIRVIRKYIRNKYGKNQKFDMHIYYDYSEFTRMKTSDVLYVNNIYPLVDSKITRRQLRKIISILGFRVPIKSGCFVCCFNDTKRWDFIYKHYPAEYNKSLELLQNSTLRKKELFFTKGSGRCGCF